LQRWPVEVGAGAAAVVEAFGKIDPALGLLAGDVGLGRLALGVQRVELLIEALLGRLAGIDETADRDGRKCQSW
jgi:hypothetical protein